MSAYSASPPVMTRTTEPSTKKDKDPLACTNCTAYRGFTAARMDGCCAISTAPSVAIVTNHTSVMGPKALPTRSVPNRCTKKSVARITTVMGTMYCASEGTANSSPSMAPSTLMAGVMMPSPYRRAVPNRASATKIPPLVNPCGVPRGKISASRAN